MAPKKKPVNTHIRFVDGVPQTAKPARKPRQKKPANTHIRFVDGVAQSQSKPAKAKTVRKPKASGPPKEANNWVQALKMWNEAQGPKGMWCIPKKGTAAYDEVKAMQK